MLRLLISGLLMVTLSVVAAAEKRWGDYWEADQPVLGATLDARDWEPGNLTVRGEIVRIGEGLYGCYDVDMVRLAAVWRGEGIVAESMSGNSYSWDTRGQKVAGGQKKLPKPLGEPITTLGLVPGVGSGELPLKDPRKAGPDPADVGRGPMAAKYGKWIGRYDTAAGPVMAYEAAGVRVLERLAPWGAAEGAGYVRHFTLAERTTAITIRLKQGMGSAGMKGKPGDRMVFAPSAGCKSKLDLNSTSIEIPAGPATSVSVGIWLGPKSAQSPKLPVPQKISIEPGNERWPQFERTSANSRTKVNGGYELTEVALPTPNRWKRNVRLAGIGFFEDGSAAVSTFDGDVWLVSGLDEGLENVQWKRFAAGLFEPLNLCVADGAVMVWTRNGLVRLHDRNGDKEADFYETFCHLPPQSAETREFAMSMGLGPDGSFYVSKGAQSTTHQSMLPGTVLRIAADGGSYEVLGTGLREPFIGVHPKTGVVVASDQQGHWVPSTPVHLIEDGGWYGFYSKRQKPSKRKPTETLIWQPHRKQSSGVGMVWADDKRFGPLSGKLLGFDYKNGTIVPMDWRQDGTIGGAWVLDGKLQTGPLHAAVNPVDGQVYVVGFTLWDSVRPALSGMARLRYAGGAVHSPTSVAVFSEGILVEMAEVLDPVTARDRANYAVQRWNYLRSGKYGSGHYLPGSSKAGQEPLPVQSVTLSKDGKAVFLRLADNGPAQQLTVDFKAKGKSGKTGEYSVWTTVRKTKSFEPGKHGFPALRPPEKGDLAVAAGEVSVALGKQVAAQFGCIACHSTDGSTEGRSGPSWKGLYGSVREAAKPRKGKAPKSQEANEVYLNTAIIDPTAFVLKGYDKEGVGMPAYAGVLKPHQIKSIIAYIRTLR